MKGFFIVLGREIAERRLLFFVGLLGLVPLLLPFVVPGSGVSAAELRTGSALMLAALVGAVLALGLGASVLGRDLAERRLGFFFSRPLSGVAIWGGKLAAALALSLGASLLVLLPVLLVESGAWGELAGGGSRPLLGLGLLVALVLLANIFSIMVRARTPWLILDIVAAGTVGLVGWHAVERLMLAGLVSAGMVSEIPASLLTRAALALIPVALAATLAGSAAQVLGGRTDPRRAHQLLSLTFWGFLLAGALGLEGYSRWLVAATPDDLATIGNVLASSTGSAVAVQGRAARRPGYAPAFLIDSANGHFHRIFPSPYWDPRRMVHFSGDGRQAVWLEPQTLSGGQATVLFRLDLGRADARPLRTSVTFGSFPSALALSPDGRRLATVLHGRLVAEDLESTRLLAAVSVGPGTDWRSQLRFLDDSHVRYFRTVPIAEANPYGPSMLRITDLDLATGRQEEVGQTTPIEEAASWTVSPDGSHIALHPGGGALALFAARGGAPLAEIGDVTSTSGFLADGRVLAANTGGGTRQLTLLSIDGAVLRRFAFPGARALRLGGEPIPGHVVVAVAPASSSPGPVYDRPGLWESRLLDLTTGESRSLGRGLLPYGAPTAGPQGSGSRLFLRDGQRLVLLDPVTGRERQVAGRPG
jgi:hypothetical protein